MSVIKKTTIISIFIIITVAVVVSGYIMNLKSGISENLLRLHVVGASNSATDQALKLAVRDRILADFSEEFSHCNSAKEATKCASALKSQIEESALSELSALGCNAPVTATVENCKFPTKTYGNIALPGGSYTALNVKIGDAKGKNWWCVMYPPLCITDKSIVMSESSQQLLKSSLSEDEYLLISESNRPDIKIKFRIAEILGEIFE